MGTRYVTLVFLRNLIHPLRQVESAKVSLRQHLDNQDLKER